MQRGRSSLIGVIVCMMLAMPTLSWAVRPPHGGLFTYADEDELAFFDSADERIRVHYSVSGPNVTSLEDLDGDGESDFVQLVAEVGERALLLLSDDIGFRAPLDDTSLDVFDDGGSSAVDIYLVDFGGQSDGSFAIDKCNTQGACSGAVILENDFRGYGYRSVVEAVETVVPHELFHATEAAYVASTPIWVSEGLAVWTERQFAPDSRDFLGFISAYLEDTARPFHRPPGGPVPAFAYGVGLWWEFLFLEFGEVFILDYLQALAGSEVFDDDQALEVLIEHIETYPIDLDSLWDRFALYNLATGSRAGGLESYRDAERMVGLLVEAINVEEGVEAKRYYPLTAHYYELDWSESAAWMGASQLEMGLRGHLIRTDAAGKAEEVALSFQFDRLPIDFQEQGVEPGRYYLVVTNSSVGTNSIRSALCFGGAFETLSCLPADPDAGGDGSEQTQEITDAGCTQSQVTELWGLCLLWLVVRRGRFRTRLAHR